MVFFENLLLSVNNLKTHFHNKQGTVHAVDGISFNLDRGDILGLVGESGSGKSAVALSIMQLIPPSAGKIIDGEIWFEGKDLVTASEVELQAIRGTDMAMIFQDPRISLNPVYTIGNQLMEMLTYHRKMTRKQARRQAIEMLSLVGIPSPERRIDEYPHQLSGGMCQRVMIAIALSCYPKLLIADEPTTALDVTIQAQILDLLVKLQQEYKAAVIIITHNLGVIAELVEKVIVMYAGKIMELADTETLFSQPLHPYTEGLLASIPRMDKESKRLKTIPGFIQNRELNCEDRRHAKKNSMNANNMMKGCRFYPRCSYAKDICCNCEPPLFSAGKTHQVACWRFVEYKCDN